jgi:hypothetical protein
MLVWGPEADVAVDDDKHWSVAGVSASFHRRSKTLCVVGIADMFDIPAVGEKARGDVFAEGEVGVAFDGYPVAVVNPAQIAEHLVPRKRCGLARHALHHVAVATHCINDVIEDTEVGPVETLRQPARRECHADAIATALTEGTGRCFDSRRQTVFRMTGTIAADLTKPLDILERDREFSRRLIVS